MEINSPIRLVYQQFVGIKIIKLFFVSTMNSFHQLDFDDQIDNIIMLHKTDRLLFVVHKS